jgi:hypothetical protein
MQKKNKSVQLVDSGNILDVGFKRWKVEIF